MINKNMSTVLITFLTLILLTQPAQAYAWGGGWDRSSHRSYRHCDHHDYDRHYPTFGKVVFELPGGYVSIVFGGKRYQYCDGVYYSRISNEYVVVAPPIGVKVRELPPEHQELIIDGNQYYVSKGVYYKYTSRGYQVIPQPDEAVIEAAKVYPDGQIMDQDDLFTVNIPNARGGYTVVTLKRSEEGYIGPQGEFYPEFPSVEQLKAMYGNNKR